MWTRRELKERGKAAFKANYWRCVLVALLLVVITGGFAAVGGGSSGALQGIQNAQDLEQPAVEQPVTITADADIDADLDELVSGTGDLDQSELLVLLPAIIMILLIAFAAAAAFSILVINPLVVGCQRFFSQNSRQPAGVGEVAYGFEHGYGRVVKTMFLNDIFIILWSLLFIIPGIVKSYSYRMVPYILAQEPELSGRDVINRSREMMDGNKWKAFVLDLSFILWILLSAITLGIVGIFFVNPYMEATNAELYHELIRQENGMVEPQLTEPGFEMQ